ncbi:efflux RND transporter permease subunit, partial [Paraburkholderia sp. SIMBA_050]
FGQRLISTIFTQSNQYRVVLEVQPQFQMNPASLGQIHVPTSTGAQVPLSNFVSVSMGVEPNKLTQFNQLNAATFQAIPMPGV